MTFICDLIIRVSVKALLFEAFVVSFSGMPVWLITPNSELRFWKTS